MKINNLMQSGISLDSEQKANEVNYSDYISQSQHLWDNMSLEIKSRTEKDVQRALATSKRTITDFISLISPAGAAYLEEMAQMSYQLTRQRFGNVIQLFVPLYLSNKCHNICTYCGFSLNNLVRRKTLNEKELEEELHAIKRNGFQHVVLLTGEAPGTVGMEYFRKIIPLVKKQIAHVSMEVQPLETCDYKELIKMGLDAVYVYQETYNKNIYAQCHLKGSKRNFTWRVNTPDRLGRAGIRKMGIATLLGLSDEWRTDLVMNAHHLSYLQKKYWKSSFSISIPRLKPCTGSMLPKALISNRHMVQIICAWRIVFPEIEISLSTREPASLRDQLCKLGVTSMSAASSTQPGGYASQQNTKHLAQFNIDDTRSVKEVVDAIKKAGMEAVWKNADPF